MLQRSLRKGLVLERAAVSGKKVPRDVKLEVSKLHVGHNCFKTPGGCVKFVSASASASVLSIKGNRAAGVTSKGSSILLSKNT